MTYHRVEGPTKLCSGCGRFMAIDEQREYLPHRHLVSTEWCVAPNFTINGDDEALDALMSEAKLAKARGAMYYPDVVTSLLSIIEQQYLEIQALKQGAVHE